MHMGRKTEAEIMKDGYYIRPHIVSKYYMDMPIGYINGKDSKLELRKIWTAKYFKYQHVAYYEGMLGNGYLDMDTNTVLSATIDITFRNLKFVLDVFNHLAFVNSEDKFGFLISCELPDGKHMVYSTNKYLMKYSPVSKPKYTFDMKFLRFVLEHDKQEYGKFHKLARQCALQMLDNM